MDQSSDHLSEMFRPFRKLLIKMRDYLRTLNKTELFQLEKLLCTNEEINLTQSTPDESTSQCIDEQKTLSTTTNVTILRNSDTITTSKSDENFYSIEKGSKAGDWVAEEAEAADDEAEEESSNYDNLVTADCATGYLVPNTNLGNLLQPNVAPLTYNIVPNDNQEATGGSSSEGTTNQDSGMGTGDKGSLDRSPEQENQNVLTGQYDENWENLRKIVEPSSSKGPSTSHQRSKDRSGKKKSRKHHMSSSDDTSTSSTSSSSASSSPTTSASGECKDVSRRIKFK